MGLVMLMKIKSCSAFDRQADEKEIQNLQREVANAESKLADQEPCSTRRQQKI